jgi:hypothetical protein
VRRRTRPGYYLAGAASLPALESRNDLLGALVGRKHRIERLHDHAVVDDENRALQKLLLIERSPVRTALVRPVSQASNVSL